MRRGPEIINGEIVPPEPPREGGSYFGPFMAGVIATLAVVFAKDCVSSNGDKVEPPSSPGVFRMDPIDCNRDRSDFNNIYFDLVEGDPPVRLFGDKITRTREGIVVESPNEERKVFSPAVLITPFQGRERYTIGPVPGQELQLQLHADCEPENPR